jgi:serine/threonine protein kinase
MALTPGARIGVYETNALIGAGGMGEVYRAHDTKLNRDVALKILPESFTHDPDRLARFKREAQVLAALNHPHIGAIYGLDEANRYQFLVLELIHGETLADLIAKGPLPLDEALSIATQIAEALEAARVGPYEILSLLGRVGWVRSIARAIAGGVRCSLTRNTSTAGG